MKPFLSLINKNQPHHFTRIRRFASNKPSSAAVCLCHIIVSITYNLLYHSILNDSSSLCLAHVCDYGNFFLIKSLHLTVCYKVLFTIKCKKNRQIGKKTAILKDFRLENLGCCKYQLIFVTAENIFSKPFLAETTASAFHPLALRVIIL